MRALSLITEPEEVAAAWDRLKAKGFRRTKPRAAVLQALASGHGPFSAEDIFRVLSKKKSAPIDLVTVYRNLQGFQEAGIARVIDLGDQIARYELSLDPGHHHHHVTCRSCRKTLPLDDCFLEEIEGRIARVVAAKGFSEVEHRLEFLGICDACSRSRPKSRV
ncbi:MAG: transcriptional repressor [Cryobacterium sp.]|nr:transcriptional repressor [Oligoflexia bacterium]